MIWLVVVYDYFGPLGNLYRAHATEASADEYAAEAKALGHPTGIIKLQLFGGTSDG